MISQQTAVLKAAGQAPDQGKAVCLGSCKGSRGGQHLQFKSSCSFMLKACWVYLPVCLQQSTTSFLGQAMSVPSVQWSAVLCAEGIF